MHDNYDKQQESPYELISSEKITIGRITVVKDEIMVNGQAFPYTYTEIEDSVCILPVYRNKIVAIHQYRHSIEKWAWEFPAGVIDIGESPEDAACRELKEETGYVASSLVSLGRYYVSQGTSSAMCSVYFARCDFRTDPELDATEQIKTKLFSYEEFAKMIKDNNFTLIIGIVAWYRAIEEGCFEDANATKCS